MSTATYTTAKDITVLEGLEPVRKRPAMYIGDTDKKGLHHLVWEIVDNSVDEYLNGYADSITVELHKNGDAVTIADNGRGIPVDMHPKYKKPGLELLLTTLHSGAKFGEGDSYLHSGGLHGVGSSVVNALSRKLVANVRRDGFEWEQTFKRGKPAGDMREDRPLSRPRHHHLLRAGPRHLQEHPLRSGMDQVASRGHVVHPQRPQDHLQE